MCSHHPNFSATRIGRPPNRSLGALGLSVVLATPSQAQSINAQRHMQIGLSAITEYDDNVLRLSDQDPARTRGDHRLSATLSLDVARPIGHQDIYLIGQVGENRYARHAQLDNVTSNLQAGVDWRAGIGCVLRTGGAFSQQLVKIEDVTSSTLAPSTQTSHASVVGLSCARGRVVRPSLNYRDERITNSAAALHQNDTRTQSYDVSLGIQRPRLGELSLFGAYRRTRYPNHIAQSPEYVSFTDAGLRLTRGIGGRIVGNATLSYNRVAPESSATRPYSGLGWTADLTITPGGGRAHLTLALSRATQQSTLLNVSYSIDAANHFGLDYALTHRIKLATDVALTRRSFVGVTGSSSALGLGDRSASISAGLRYQAPLKFLSAPIIYAFNASYSRRTADNPAFDYRDMQASVSLRIGN